MSHRDFSDQVVVITGASGGVGAAAAEELARRGASVVLAARRAGPLGDVAKRCGSQVHPVVADVTKRDDVQRIFYEAIARFDRVDVWINNVGRGIGRPLLEITDDDIDAMIRDNMKSALYGMQVVTPHLKARGTGVVCDAALSARGDVYTQPNAFARVREYLEKQPG